MAVTRNFFERPRGTVSIAGIAVNVTYGLKRSWAVAGMTFTPAVLLRMRSSMPSRLNGTRARSVVMVSRAELPVGDGGSMVALMPSGSFFSLTSRSMATPSALERCSLIWYVALSPTRMDWLIGSTDSVTVGGGSTPTPIVFGGYAPTGPGTSVDRES